MNTHPSNSQIDAHLEVLKAMEVVAPHALEVYKERTKHCPPSIQGAFIWSGTPEGHGYWLEVHEAVQRYIDSHL